MRGDISLDETMFVIGSGPCLNEIDIKLLKGLHTISLNRQYLAYEEWGFWPKYYVCIDARLVRKIYKKEIVPMMLDQECEIEKFFIRATELPEHASLDAVKHSNPPDKLIRIPPPVFNSELSPVTLDKFKSCYVNTELAESRQTINPATDVLSPTSCLFFGGLSGAFSVTLARSLGYKRIVLLGIDAKYVGREESLKAGRDLNHFHPNYFDVEEFAYGQDYGPATGYIEPWRAMATIEPSVEEVSTIVAAGVSLEIQEKLKMGGLPEAAADKFVSTVYARDLELGRIDALQRANARHLSRDKTLEIISCSPGSIINTLFPYHDFEKLLKTYEVNNEN